MIRAPAYSSKHGACYIKAHDAAAAEKLVEGFVSRALEDPGLVHKERFLGTPALFAYLSSLVDTARQRSMKEATVARYFDDYKAGRWRAGAGNDYLLIDRGGKTWLYDGQHRAAAFAQANAAMEVWLSHSKDPLAFVGIDQNKGRSPADIRKMRSGKNLPGAALSAGIIEKLNFPGAYRGSNVVRDAELEAYDLLPELEHLPRGRVGELASLLRAQRFDPPGMPLARAWFDAFLAGDTDICGVHEPTLKQALRVWARQDKQITGDIRTKLVSLVTGACYRAFYEGRDEAEIDLPTKTKIPTAEHPISMAYVAEENAHDHRRMKVRKAVVQAVVAKAAKAEKGTP